MGGIEDNHRELYMMLRKLKLICKDYGLTENLILELCMPNNLILKSSGIIVHVLQY
jgi:hypothetical protein